jgi:hypothetical protein
MKTVWIWLLLVACATAQGKISPVWQNGTTPAGEAVRRLLSADPFHTRLPETLNGLLKLPRNLPVVYCQNGAINAWYSPNQHQVTVSYDLAIYMQRLVKSDELTKDCLDFILMHEFGHALIHELDLPLVGSEEDAADEFATVVCAQALGVRGRQMAMNAAMFFSRMGDSETKLSKLHFYDEHSLNKQRYYRILANLHAAQADPAIERIVPVTRLMEAKSRYAARVQHWNRLLSLHEKIAGGPPLQSVVVDPARKRHLTLMNEGTSSSRLSPMVDLLDKMFVLPKNLTVVERSTGLQKNLFLPLSGQIMMSREFFESARPKLANPQDFRALEDFSLLQEFSLALITDCDLPFTGDVEDAAAELTAILVASSPKLQHLGSPMILWYSTLVKEHRNVLDLKYWSVSALDEQRFFQLLGYLYCQDPKLAPDAVKLIPAKRLKKFAHEYAQKRRNWARLLQPFMAR